MAANGNILEIRDLHKNFYIKGQKLEVLSGVNLTVKDGELVGLISTGDIAKSYMDVYDNTILAKARTQYRNIVRTLDGEIVTGNEHGWFSV